MIVGLPNKLSRFALPRIIRRAADKKPSTIPRMRLGLFTSFSTMMERHADLIFRGVGE